MVAGAHKIAVTVVGGYLGAGKTPLLNNILRSADERLAVLVNDFGEINIDASLVVSRDESTINLANGCICCSLADGLANAMFEIDELIPRPERLIIEASGVANPAGVAAYCHRRGFRLDATIVLADAETITTTVTDEFVGETVRSQLRSADLVVLNKVDLVDDPTLASARTTVAEFSPEAPVVETVDAQVAPQVLFDVDPTLATGDPHTHGADFEAWSFTTATPLERTTIERFMAELSNDVLRLKGLVMLDDDERCHVLQRVGPRWTLRPDDEPSAPAATALVAIGRPGCEPSWPSGA